MTARVELTVQEIDRDGLKVSYATGDATNDHSWDNRSEDIFIHLINAGSSICVITFLTPKTIDGLEVGDKIVNVPVGENWFIGPFRNDLYGQKDDDNDITKAVLVNLDQHDGVTLAAIKLGNVNF